MDEKVLVTGATGFLGKHVLNSLKNYGFTNVIPVGFRNAGYHNYFDLTSESGITSLFKQGPFSYVLHLAGYNGGIKKNINEPANIFFQNTMMALNLLSFCQFYKVKKFVGIVASCAYPSYDYGKVDCAFLHECDFLGDNNPDETVEGHGFAKRNMQIACKLYNRQYGLNAVCLCPTTLYGPGDSYHPDNTKVMGGMVKRFVDAVDDKCDNVDCWGTGSPLREFLYVKDAANLIVECMVKYNESTEPLNLGTGQELNISNLANKVAYLCGYNGKINWDKTKADGQYRKRLVINKMLNLIPDFYPTRLEDGIMDSIEDYKQRKGNGEFK